MKERIMGKGSIKRRLGKDEQASLRQKIPLTRAAKSIYISKQAESTQERLSIKNITFRNTCFLRCLFTKNSRLSVVFLYCCLLDG